MIFNEFRLVGDFLHGSAILFLIFHIIKTRSCHSISGLTIILYTIVFSCRYLDLFSPAFFISIYNDVFKISYLVSNFLLLSLIYGFFRHTRDQSRETFPIFGYIIIAHLVTWMTCYYTGHNTIDREYFWRFSIYLEMLAIIPQLVLIAQQGLIEKEMIYYVIMLGSYRGFYILNWIDRYYSEGFLEPISFFCGCIQTIIYLYFFIHIYPRINQNQSNEISTDLKIKIVT